MTETSYYGFSHLFTRLRYPAGELHISLQCEWNDLPEDLVIEMRCQSFDDLGMLLTADRLLKEHKRKPTWFVPYFPFARQDRRTDDRSGFELAVALDLVRDIDIVIADPHSDVAGLLPHIPQERVVAAFVHVNALGAPFAQTPMIVIPDKGATNKAMTWIGGSAYIQGEKHRDPSTGKLSGFSVPDHDLMDCPCVIVDDICDGGGTFIGLAKKLKEKGAGSLTLAVTHGLFTKGMAALNAYFDHVYTFSYHDETPSGVVYASFEDLWNTHNE